MKDLLQGVWEHIQRFDTFAGSAYLGFAQADAEMPYVVMQPGMSMSPDYRTDREYMQTRTIRFSVFGVSSIGVAEWIDKLESAFTSTAMPVLIARGSVLNVMKGGDDLDLDPDRLDDGQEVWHGIIDLDFRIQRSEN